jgi:cell division protein ZapA
MSQGNTMTVHILDKEYQVACPEDQQAELVVSAKYLDKQMRSIRDTGKVIGLERIAVMAALNISYELLQASEQGAMPDTAADGGEASYRQLNHKIDEALYQLRQLEIG